MLSSFFPYRLVVLAAAAALAAASLGAPPAAGAQAGTPVFTRSGAIRWDRGELSAEVSLDLASAGIRFPAGRLTAEDLLEDEYPRLLRPGLLSLQVDSTATVGDLVQTGELTLSVLDGISRGARQIAPSLSTDLTTMTGRYTLSIAGLGAALARHRLAVDPPRVLTPVPAADYTGIVIIADEELPLHGRAVTARLVPCLFPKIWDTAMTLVYDRDMTAPAFFQAGSLVTYVSRDSVFAATPSGISPELETVVGTNPLRVLAREVFGVCPTDVVIDREDAVSILSNENNRRLLREGRIALVLDSAALAIPLAP